MKLHFVWRGHNAQQKKTRGTINASSLLVAKAQLAQQGITVHTIYPTATATKQVSNRSVKANTITQFTRQLATLIKAGIPLLQALNLLERSEKNPTFRHVIFQVKTAVHNGSSFSEALKAHPNCFNSFYQQLVATGELSGTMETMMQALATHRERLAVLRQKVYKALLYPTLIVLAAGIITMLLLGFVVPQFEQLFSGFNATLPAFTRWVIACANHLQTYFFWLCAGGLFCSGGGYYSYRRFESVRHQSHRLALALPFFGPLWQTALISRFAQTLAITFAAGLPLLDALTAIRELLNNRVYQHAFQDIRTDVSNGVALHQAMANTGLFSDFCLQMIAIGESAGALETMLEKIYQTHADRLTQTIEQLNILLEPVIMIGLGIVLGGLIIAMYLPIFQLGAIF